MGRICELIRGDDIICIQDNGGMVTGEFAIAGKRINPFYTHPWEEYEREDLLGFLQGDFVCLPFGITPCEPIEGYSYNTAGKTEYAHGYSSNGKWKVEEYSEEEATISIGYCDDVVKKIDRSVSFLTDKKGINFKCTVYMNEDAKLPFGIHPVFRLPKKPGDASLILPGSKGVRTYPVFVDDNSHFIPNSSLKCAKNIPLIDGGFADATSLPLEFETEEILYVSQLEEGKISMENYAENYRVTLEFDLSTPNVMLWISNKGRQFEPWSGRNVCLGVEPVAAAFDFGSEASAGDNPLNLDGIKTYVQMNKDKPFVYNYSIYVEEL